MNFFPFNVRQRLRNRFLGLEDRQSGLERRLNALSRQPLDFSVTPVLQNGASSHDEAGLKIIGGETGTDSRLIARMRLDPQSMSAMAGEIARFELDHVCSPAFMDMVKSGQWTLFYIDRNGSGQGEATINPPTLEVLSEDVFRWSFDLRLKGDEQELRVDFAVRDGRRTSVGRWVRVSRVSIISPQLIPLVSRAETEPTAVQSTGWVKNLLPSSDICTKSGLGTTKSKGGQTLSVEPQNVDDTSFLGFRLPIPDLPAGSYIQIEASYRISVRGRAAMKFRPSGLVRLADGSVADGVFVASRFDAGRLVVTADVKVRDGMRSAEIRLFPQPDRQSAVETVSMSIENVSARLKSIPGQKDIGTAMEGFAHSIRSVSAFRPKRLQTENVPASPRALLDKVASIGAGRSPVDRRRFQLSLGLHGNLTDLDKALSPGAWTKLSGSGHSGETVLDFRSRINAPQQKDRHGLFIHESVDLERLTLLQENGRYALHIDPGGKAQGDHVSLDDVRLRHFGNEGERSWRSPSALGMGGCTGFDLKATTLDLQSSTLALGWHDAADQLEPITSRIDTVYAVSDDPKAPSIRLTSIGSGQINHFDVGTIVTDGYLSLGSVENHSRRRETYTANFANWRVRHRQGMPIGWIVEQPYETLVLRSRPVEGSSLLIEGDDRFGFGAPHAGGKTDAAFVAMIGAISPRSSGKDMIEARELSLGHRLGDLSDAPATLAITFEDAAWLLDLNQDFTEWENEAILDWLNAALKRSPAGAGRSFSIERIWDCWADVRQPMGERVGVNRAARVVRKGTALQIRNDGFEIASEGTPRPRFAGVAMTRSVEGERVIVQHRGSICAQHVVMGDVDLSFGTLLSCGPDGVFEETDNPDDAILKVVRENSTLPHATILSFEI